MTTNELLSLFSGDLIDKAVASLPDHYLWTTLNVRWEVEDDVKAICHLVLEEVEIVEDFWIDDLANDGDFCANDHLLQQLVIAMPERTGIMKQLHRVANAMSIVLDDALLDMDEPQLTRDDIWTSASETDGIIKLSINYGIRSCTCFVPVEVIEEEEDVQDFLFQNIHLQTMLEILAMETR